MGDWQHGICGCFADIKICIVNWFCGPCSVGYQHGMVQGKGGMDWICCILTVLFGCIPAGLVRQKLRAKYSIEGSLLMDILCSWFCGPCAIIQQANTIKAKGDKPAGCCMD